MWMALEMEKVLIRKIKMRKTLIILFGIILNAGFSQELSKKINLNLSKKTEIFQIVENEKNSVTFFLTDKKNCKSIRLNENFEINDSLSTQIPSKNFNEIVGYSSKGNIYFTYWSSSNNKEIFSQCYDFDTKQVTSKSFDLVYEKERVLKKITVNNDFYIITVLKNTSILNFYKFNDGNLVKKTVDLTNNKFLNSENRLVKLWDVFNEGFMYEPSFMPQTISNESPPSLVFSSPKRKVYTSGNKIIFSSDISTTFTQLLTINLDDFTGETKTFNQPFLKSSGEYNVEDSNSFFINENLIQSKLNPEKMIISIKKLDGSEIKKFEIISDSPIDFKNSEIIQENGSVKNTRILDNSNQLLRKIFNQYPSLSCYNYNNKNYFTIGSVSPPSQNAEVTGAMIGGLTGAIIGMAISSNYSVNNLNSYNGRKIVYINCLFDENFNHINGDLKKLAFDELRAFYEKNNELTSKTIFKIKSNLYFGGYNKEEKSYMLYKFND